MFHFVVDESKTTLNILHENEEFIDKSILISNTIPNDSFANSSVKNSDLQSSFDESPPEVLINKFITAIPKSSFRTKHYSGAETQLPTDKLECIKSEPVDDLIPIISTDDVKPVFCEPNSNKNSPLTSTIDFASKTEELNVKSSVKQNSLTVSNTNIKSEPDDEIIYDIPDFNVDELAEFFYRKLNERLQSLQI